MAGRDIEPRDHRLGHDSVPSPDAIRRTLHRQPWLVHHVQTNHRGADVFVPRSFLNRPDVSSSFQQMSGKTVAQRMGHRVLHNARLLDRRHVPPHGLRMIRRSGLYANCSAAPQKRACEQLSAEEGKAASKQAASEIKCLAP